MGSRTKFIKEDEDDEIESIYQQLSASERIVNGQVSVDWTDLPIDILSSLENFELKKSNNNTSSLKSQGLAQSESAPKLKPYTFNNCHFHYEKIASKGKLNENLKTKRIASTAKRVSISPERQSFRPGHDSISSKVAFVSY